MPNALLLYVRCCCRACTVLPSISIYLMMMMRFYGFSNNDTCVHMKSAAGGFVSEGNVGDEQRVERENRKVVTLISRGCSSCH